MDSGLLHSRNDLAPFCIKCELAAEIHLFTTSSSTKTLPHGQPQKPTTERQAGRLKMTMKCNQGKCNCLHLHSKRRNKITRGKQKQLLRQLCECWSQAGGLGRHCAGEQKLKRSFAPSRRSVQSMLLQEGWMHRPGCYVGKVKYANDILVRK